MMKKLLTACLLTTALCGAVFAETILFEGFEGTFPPVGWTQTSVDQATTYAKSGTYSARLGAAGDSLITPPLTNAQTLVFWTYTTSSNPDAIVETSTSASGPWTAVTGSPFSGTAEQWNEWTVTLGSTETLYVQFRKDGSGTLYIDDISADNEATGNSAPVLASIGDKAVVVSNELSFTVSATDINGDDIVLSVAGLPDGAVFNTVTNTAAATNTFTWTSAAPTGTYSVTFFADDGTTNTSETVTITVSEPSVLMLTEIADPDMTGGQNFRFVEIYNAGNETIDLAAEGWFLSKQVNGGSSWDDVALTGTVAAAETYVIAYSSSDFLAAYGFDPDQADSDISGTGNDAYFLYSGGDHTAGTLVDIYGEIDTDGTGTAWDYTDSRAARNAAASGPSPVWIESQWDITVGASTNNMNPGIAYGQPPVLNVIGDKSVLEDQTLSFSVTASDPVDGDPVTLTATNLPSGAAFSNGTFTWSNASPAGEYNVTFTATDKDGSDSEAVTITVIEKPLLLISEVADPAGSGGGNYRFVELWNAGTNTIDLAADNWTLSMQDNGDANDWRDIALTGSVGPTGAYVVAYNTTNFLAAYGFEPDQADENVIAGNGRDTYAIFYGGDHSTGTLVDIYGEINVDGTNSLWSYEDDRAERNNPVLEPNPIWTASEWTLSVFTYTNEFTPGIHGPTPEFIPALQDQEVTLGDTLSLTVTATNVVYQEEVISLSATVLPDGATFPTVEGTGTVSGVLNWSPAAAGYYTARFAAKGIVGTTTESITIHVVDVTATEPVINLTVPTGGSIAIAWPAGAGSAFNVLTNGNLLNTNGWGNADLTPFLDGDSYKATNAIGSDPTLFYKLESQ